MADMAEMAEMIVKQRMTTQDADVEMVVEMGDVTVVMVAVMTMEIGVAQQYRHLMRQNYLMILVPENQIASEVEITEAVIEILIVLLMILKAKIVIRLKN